MSVEGTSTATRASKLAAHYCRMEVYMHRAPDRWKQGTTILGLALSVLAVNAKAQSLTAAGTRADGNARWGYYSCATLNCAVAAGELSRTNVGGNGVAASTTNFIGNNNAYPGSAYEMYYADARFVGPLGNAQLRALAESREVPGTNAVSPGTVCCYNYTASANANAVQWYSFSGLTDVTYRVQFTVDAIMDGFQGLEEYLALASVAGSVFASNGMSNPELPLGFGLGGGLISFTGVERDPFNRVVRSAFFDFTVTGGSAGFFLSSTLSANALFSPYSSANAANTMRQRFIGGDLSLLTAAIPGAPLNTVVPEPSTYMLMAIGLAALGAASARRQRGRTATA
jgi:hypothetical protein